MNVTIRGSLPLEGDLARMATVYDELDELVTTLIDQEFKDELRRVRRALLD